MTYKIKQRLARVDTALVQIARGEALTILKSVDDMQLGGINIFQDSQDHEKWMLNAEVFVLSTSSFYSLEVEVEIHKHESGSMSSTITRSDLRPRRDDIKSLDWIVNS